jgi:glucose/arabinose dehydrogenase
MSHLFARNAVKSSIVSSCARSQCAALLSFIVLVFGADPLAAAPPKEEDYYRLITLPIPEGIVLEVGGIASLPDGKLAVSSRRGDIYLVENPFSDPPTGVHFTKFAEGLHEVLGLTWDNGWLYATQRGEVTRLKDQDGDGRADVIETVCDGWEISGDYHEYAFGSDFDKEGNMWVVLCLTGSFTSNVKYRGWCVRVSRDGKLTPTCSGIRSPGGIGFNHLGDCFYTDNQGPWNGSCGLKWLQPGSFQGHPEGNRWYSATTAIGLRPKDPKSESRMVVEAKKIPQLMPTAVFFPYDKMGKSASGIACDTTGGKFGPFGDQLFVGDQSHSTVMRVFLEKVKGRYQGACFMFREGFDSGSLPMRMTPDGSLFVGCTNRGWGSRGNKEFALQRLVWSGKVPFEVHEMRAKPDGFELTFTQPLDAKTAVDLKSYKMTTYTYIYRAQYGSPEVDQTTPKLRRVTVADDRRSARLEVEGLQEGHVHELHLGGVRSADGLPLLHKTAYYTLNYIP